MTNNQVVPLEMTDSMAVKIIRECVDQNRVIFTSPRYGTNGPANH